MTSSIIIEILSEIDEPKITKPLSTLYRMKLEVRPQIISMFSAH